MMSSALLLVLYSTIRELLSLLQSLPGPAYRQAQRAFLAVNE